MNKVTTFLLTLVVLLSFVILPHQSLGQSESGAIDKAGREFVMVSGQLNVREIFYVDSRSAYDYLLIGNDTASDGPTRYLLDFGGDDGNSFASELLSHIGSHVVVEGFVDRDRNDEGGRSQTSSAEPGSSTREPNYERRIVVESVDIEENEDSDPEIDIGSTLHKLPASATRTLNQVAVPARYADIETKPHSIHYYRAQFYGDERYSLAAYWRDASYGRFALEGKVIDWVDLPNTEEQYLDFGQRESHLISAADSEIDFDGPDNLIDNISSHDLDDIQDHDDIDSVVGIYNGMVGPGIAGYAYLAPIRLSTQEGSLFTYFVAISDTGYGSPPGEPSNYFVGLAAHEIGHNLGWHHTASPDCVHCDPWSLMSGGIYSDLGPSGPIASHRESEGWIEPNDIMDFAELTDQIVEFDLDMLGRPSGENYLMAKVSFGHDGHYYIIEARKNTANDHTPMEKTGLIVYHYSPTGHPESMEPRSHEMLVDTTEERDLANAVLEEGESFADLKNGITITNLAGSSDSITVRVTRDGGFPADSDPCVDLVPTIEGTPRDDVIKGTEGSDVINGKGGNDVIYGMGGKDTICGGRGDDVLEGGDDDDLLVGNFGEDKITGGPGNDKLVGGRGADELAGGDGDDVLEGWSGNDKLVGGNGNDSLYGGDGEDYLLGGDGNDKLRGWLGDDTYADKSDKLT